MKKRKTGQTLVYILVFGTGFLIVIFGFSSLFLSQYRQANQRLALEKAFTIAESGINYFQWCLNNKKENQCLGTKDYYDSAGRRIGKFEITDIKTESCGQTIRHEVISVGYTNQYPNLKRKIKAVFARPSVAYYSYLLNSDVWIGADHEIKGPYHSNGGIRMDGENSSIVSSAKEEWVCDDSFGCTPCPSKCTVRNFKCYCPGVFTTANGNESLFQFPNTAFSFEKITIDLNQLKQLAQRDGIYLGPSSTRKGYHLIFLDDGRLEIREIQALTSVYAYSLEEGWHYDDFIISRERTINTLNIPSSCSIIFVEDNIWPEGKISGSITLAGANLIDPNKKTNAILRGNINYKNKNTDSFTLIAKDNILIAPDSPNVMELFGIYIAQRGRFSRNHYPGNYREKLEIKGSIISNGRVGTKWVSSNGVWVSGYNKRETMYEPRLLYCAPPFTPAIEADFRLISWQEE